MEEGMQQVFRDLETLRRCGPGMDPVGYQMREKQLVQTVLENVERTTPIDLINVLKNHHGAYTEMSLFGALSHLAPTSYSLPSSSLLSLFSVLRLHSSFDTQKEQILNELLGRIRMGKLSNLEMVDVVGFLCPQNEKLGFSLRKLRDGLVEEKEQEKRRETDKLVSINVNNPSNFVFPSSIGVNYGFRCASCGVQNFLGVRFVDQCAPNLNFCASCYQAISVEKTRPFSHPDFADNHPLNPKNPPHQPFRVHQRAAIQGGGEGEPTSFCLDVEFQGAFKERVGRGDVEIRSGVDGTISLERDCGRGREGGGKNGLVVLVSIPPYNESVTKYIGSLTEEMTSLSVNFAMLCDLFRADSPSLIIHSLRIGAVIRDESYCLDKHNRELEGLRAIQPFLLKSSPKPPSSSSSSSSSSSLRESTVAMESSDGKGVVMVCYGDLRSLRVSPTETYGHLKKRACSALKVEGDPSFYTLQDEDFNDHNTDEVVDPNRTPVVRLHKKTNVFGNNWS